MLDSKVTNTKSWYVVCSGTGLVMRAILEMSAIIFRENGFSCDFDLDALLLTTRVLSHVTYTSTLWFTHVISR